MYKKAFTLAEVLITLGIIGVVAALTIPILINSYQKKQTVAQLKVGYSILEGAIKRSESDNGEIKHWSNWSENGGSWNQTGFMEKFFLPYMTYKKAYGPTSPEKAMCYEGGTMINGDHQYNWLTSKKQNVSTRTAITPPFERYTTSILLANGMCMGINENFGSNKRNFFIDINGSYKGPNIIGKDLFIFTFDDKWRVKPLGWDRTSEDLVKDQNGACNADPWQAGATCAAKIMKDGWKINDDYPW